MIRTSRELLSTRADVWALVAEPHHLSDWWPGYTGVRPDRRGLAEGARWSVTRGRAPGLLRRPGGEGLLVIQRVVPGLELVWLDVQQGVEAGIELANAADSHTLATAWVDGPLWRIVTEGARSRPAQALARLHDLCQTAAEL